MNEVNGDLDLEEGVKDISPIGGGASCLGRWIDTKIQTEERVLHSRLQRRGIDWGGRDGGKSREM